MSTSKTRDSSMKKSLHDRGGRASSDKHGVRIKEDAGEGDDFTTEQYAEVALSGAKKKEPMPKPLIPISSDQFAFAASAGDKHQVTELMTEVLLDSYWLGNITYVSGSRDRLLHGGSAMILNSENEIKLDDLTKEEESTESEEDSSKRASVISSTGECALYDEHAEKNEVMELYLQETETMWFTQLASVSASSLDNDGKRVKQRNNDYIELCKVKVGNDMYVDCAIGMFARPKLFKSTQTNAVSYQSKGSLATTWDIYDSFQSLAQTQASAANDADSSANENETAKAEPTVETPILELSSLKQSLLEMERVLCLNTYQKKLARYRELPTYDVDWNFGEPNVPDDSSEISSRSSINEVSLRSESADPDTGSVTELDVVEPLVSNVDMTSELWKYECALTAGLSVSCMTWNARNLDLLAVGYCDPNFMKPKDGLVCCWSVKNLQHPEKFFRTEVGVTSIAFSHLRPNILAVGFYDGVISIYDVTVEDIVPLADTKLVVGRHISTVYQLAWIRRELDANSEHPERLTSVSADGLVVQWIMRTGLEANTIHKLKRLTEKPTSEIKKKSDGTQVSQLASGLCFSFARVDENLYLVGTESGNIHKCMCSHTEQYIDTFSSAHAGPVFGVEWSPFNPDIFVSCGGDWFLRIWLQDEMLPAISLTSDTKSVVDVAWCPTNEYVLASINEDSLQIWDISVNSVAPVCVVPAISEAKLRCVRFAHSADCVLVADSVGAVTFYHIRGLASARGKTLIEVVREITANTFN